MSVKNFCKDLYGTLRAQLPSDMHREAWKDYQERIWLRDRLMTVVGFSIQVVNIIAGLDAASFKKEIMNDESYETGTADILDFDKLKVFHDISLTLIGVLLAMSFKWHRLSQCLYYSAMLFFMSEALLIVSENRVWIHSPLSKVIAA